MRCLNILFGGKSDFKNRAITMIFRAVTLLLACVLTSSFGFAQTSRTYGDWSVIDADDGSGDVISATVSDKDAAEILAIRCFIKEQKCIHVLRLKSRCEPNASYPMLLNSPGGASLVSGYCYSEKNGFELTLSPFDSIRGPIDDADGMLGFGIPLASGLFRAIRFSLKGSRTAREAAELIAQARRARPLPSNTPKQTYF